jgi:hypothetical protein
MPKKDEGNQTQKFLNWEFLTLSINASMQTRAGCSIYRGRNEGEIQNHYDKEKAKFRESFRRKLARVVNAINGYCN